MLSIRRSHFKLEADQVWEMLSAGLSMGMMSSLVNFGTLILQSGINQLGTAVIVAHTAARKVFEIWNLPVSVLGSTMATYSGQNYGAGKIDRIKAGLKTSLTLALGWCVVVFLMAAHDRTGGDRIYRQHGFRGDFVLGQHLPEIDMSFLIVCVFIVILRNTLQGMGDYVTPIVSSFIELTSKIVFTLVFVRMAGYWGVIWTEPVSWILMVIPLMIRMRKKEK